MDLDAYLASKESWPRSVARSSMDTWPSQIELSQPSGSDFACRKSFVFTVITLSTFGGLLFGYDTGVASGAMIFIRDQFNLTNFWQESIVSITIAAAWLFSMVSGYLADALGRRRVILMASLIFILGSVMLGAANSKLVLLIGRLIVGIAIGLASMIVPLYNAEISPQNLRGRLVAVYQNLICFGILAAGIVSGIFSYDHAHGWRYMLGLAAVPALIQFVGFLFMPESPRWLVKKGAHEEALKVLKKIYVYEEDAVKVLEDIVQDNRRSADAPSQSYFSVLYRIFATKHVRRALFIGCALQMFQQIIGINTIMYYSATIIESSGVKDKSTSIWLASIVAAVSFVCNFGSFYFIERFGRRNTWLASLLGVLVSLLIVAVGFQLSSYSEPLMAVADDEPSNSTCGLALNCGQCISEPGCGFCYELTSGHIKASCHMIPSVLSSDTLRGHELSGICSNATLALNSSQCPKAQSGVYSAIILFGLISYLCFFAPGVGPVPWVINSEIYPLWARSICTSIATSTNWLFCFLISMTFLSLISLITNYGAFYLYAFFALTGWIFFWKILPETKGISLEETDMLFQSTKK